jgi:hypothetical protein
LGGLVVSLQTLLEVPIAKNVVREVKIGPSIIRGALGPTDFPEALRVICSESKPLTVTISFVYPVGLEEATEERRVDDDGALRIGKITGRVHQIDLTAPNETVGIRLVADVEPALEELSAAARKLPVNDRSLPRRLAHYSMIEELLPWIAERLTPPERPKLAIP